MKFWMQYLQFKAFFKFNLWWIFMLQQGQLISGTVSQLFGFHLLAKSGILPNQEMQTVGLRVIQHSEAK